MLSQTGSATGNNLQYTRSITSTEGRQKHPLQAQTIDSQIAGNHALIAAHRAFDRSRSSASTDLVRSESALTARDNTGRHLQNVNFSPATHLRRQRSTLQSRVPRLADTLRLPEESSRAVQNQKYFDYESSFGIQSENYGAEPSSYRKLRRSKSLLTPVRRITRSSSGTPETYLNQAPTLRTTRSSTTLKSPGLKLRLKRSLNFLRQPRPTTDQNATVPAKLGPTFHCSPEAVILARNQYLQVSSRQDLLQTPSVSSSSKPRRTQKAFRSSFRGADSNSDLSIMPDREKEPEPKSEKRSISASLTSRVKKILSKTKLSEGLPPQQLEASRAHFHVDIAKKSPDAGFDSYLEGESESLRKSSLYVPSNLHPESCSDVLQLSQRLSLSGSSGSLSSASKSRVTSWTNSTATGSVAARPDEYEPKRLSIIKEDGGPHQPSSSIGRHIGGVLAFQKPLSIPEGQTVNSQRIYSALLKRIDEEQKEMERTQAAYKEIHDSKDQDNVVGHYLFSSPTIRRVDSKDSVSRLHIKESKLKGSSNILGSSTSLGAVEPESDSCDIGYVATSVQAVSNEPDLCSLANENKTDYPNPIRQLPAQRNSRPDHDSSQTFLHETAPGMRQPAMTHVYLSSSKFAQSTDSIYSRTTNGGTNPDYDSPLLSREHIESKTIVNTGMTTLKSSTSLCTSAVARPYSHSQLCRSGSTSERGSWREWMQHQMGAVESKRACKNVTGHIRECAQINPDDTEVGRDPDRAYMLVSDPMPKPLDVSRASVMNSTPHSIKKAQSSVLKLKEVPQGRTPQPSQNVSLKRSQSALHNQTKKVEEATEGRKSSALRKISPANVALMLKNRKSQPVLAASSSPAKENTPVAANNSPPLSSPGRYQIQMRRGNGTGRLRKGRSAISLNRDHNQSPPETSAMAIKANLPDYPRTALSARLSRPFDMDIPDRNRPFDSTYLGKRETGNGSRLSVATGSTTETRPKTYGDLGPPPYAGGNTFSTEYRNDSETTALPVLLDSTNAQRSVSGRSLGLVGKRIVSNFLKARVKQTNNSNSSPGGSPAFI